MALTDIAGVSNTELWNLARKADPTFESHTAEGTKELFTEKGYEAVTRNSLTDVINEWFGVSLRVAFQMLDVADARNPLVDSGLVEVCYLPNGGITQRMAMSSIKPVSPAYKGLADYTSVDQQVIKKTPIEERFFEMNFDYQALATLQDFNVKQIFISEYGMGQVLAGIMQGLQAGYTKQEYYNVLEALNAALNSTAHPLQNSQVINIDWTAGAPTVDQLKNFIRTMQNLDASFRSVASTSKYNAAGFDTIVRTSDFVALIRPDILTEIGLMNALNAPGNMSIPFSTHPIENFGGMIPVYATGDDSTDVYPVYDTLGTNVGWATEEDATTATYTDNQISWVDPNADVLAVIAQRGLILENTQNPYQVIPAPYNARGLYQNYWASRPNTGIVTDYYRNMIVIRKDA